MDGLDKVALIVEANKLFKTVSSVIGLIGQSIQFLRTFWRILSITAISVNPKSETTRVHPPMTDIMTFFLISAKLTKKHQWEMLDEIVINWSLTKEPLPTPSLHPWQIQSFLMKIGRFKWSKVKWYFRSNLRLVENSPQRKVAWITVYQRGNFYLWRRKGLN